MKISLLKGLLLSDPGPYEKVTMVVVFENHEGAAELRDILVVGAT